MRRFFFKLTWWLPLLVLMVGLNYTQDPARIFHPDPSLARSLLHGESATFYGNYDERRLQLDWIDGLSAPPPEIVLGSSRAETIGGRLNHFVSGATLPDLVAIWEIYQERGWTPQRVLLEVDPWLFNAKNREGRWRSLTPQYYRGLERLGLSQGGQAWTAFQYQFSRWSELISPSYFQDSLVKLMGGSRTPIVKEPDGSIIVPAPSPGVAEKSGAEFKDRPYGVMGYKELDPHLRATFEALLRQMRSQGSQVTLVLVPYQPLAWQSLSTLEQFRQVPACEEYLRGLGLPVLGSYAPQPGDQFWDAQHPLAVTLQRVLGASGAK